jgi:Fe-S cluster biogenesis protein NfuA/nitrite reductase/ring-hydroxylating ferredoxin subunit
MDDAMVRAHVEQLDGLLAQVEELPDGEARARALGAIDGLLQLYGEALRRIVTRCAAAPAALQELREDELVSHLMLLHDVHPATLQERVARALEEVRPYMGSHGGGIELVDVSDGVARVRLEGTCSGCAASTLTLKLAVEEAVLRAAPELRAVEAIEEKEQLTPSPSGVLVPILESGFSPGSSAGRWVFAEEAAQLAGDGPLRLEIAGSPLLFARAGGELYAYLDRCPGCRAALSEPRLEEGALCCGGCGRRYDVRRAGVGVDGGLFGLDPVPLLVEEGQVRVAVEAAAV